jgi:hypothetical protein
MPPNWYYKDGHNQIGPVDQHTLQQRIRQHQISPEQLVRREDWIEWRAAGSLPPERPEPSQFTPPSESTGAGPGIVRPAPPPLAADAIAGSTLKLIGIACALGAAVCAFVAIERYATNAAGVSHFNSNPATRELMGGGEMVPAVPTETLYALFIGALLLGCSVTCFVTLARRRQAASPPSAPPPDTDMFMIDYGHEAEGVFYHGTFSLSGGKAAAAWTEDDGDKKKRREVPMTEDAFKGIWDSLTEIADFQAGAVKDAHQPLDPRTNHVVELIFNMGGRKETRTYMIPAEGASPAFKAWLAKLG